MNKTEFRCIRKDLGLSTRLMGEALGLSDGRTIRYYERGDRRISGPIVKLMLIYKEYPLLIEDFKEE